MHQTDQLAHSVWCMSEVKEGRMEDLTMDGKMTPYMPLYTETFDLLAAIFFPVSVLFFFFFFYTECIKHINVFSLSHQTPLMEDKTA